jgi:hypothetical protein
MKQSVIFHLEDLPRWLELIPDTEREAYEVYHGLLMRAERTAEEFWRRVELPRVKKALQEWEAVMPEKFRRDARLQYLRSKKQEALEAFGRNREAYIQLVREGMDEKSEAAQDILRDAERLAKRIKGYSAAIASMRASGGISTEMLERAREYPVERLVEANRRGFAKCVNHDEKTPSMYIRKNYAYCFGCGWTGDPIDVYRKQTGANFREAVKYLNGEL